MAVLVFQIPFVAQFVVPHRSLSAWVGVDKGCEGNGYAGLRLRTTRRTKGSANIAHAHPPSNFDRTENLFVLSQYISDRGDRCIACQVKGSAFLGAL